MKYLQLTLASLLAFSALWGCGVRESETPAPEGQTVRFEIRSIGTRSVFGEKEGTTYPTFWTEQDRQISLSMNLEEALQADVLPAADGKSASFDAVLNPRTAAAPYTFHAVSPASSVIRIGKSRSAWAVTIPADQTPLEGSPQESAQLLFATSAPYEAFPEAVDINFSHLTAYGLMTLKGLDLGDATLASVEITSSTPWAGEWYASTEDGSMTPKAASSTLTLHTQSPADIWFACAPVDLSGATLRVTACASDGTARTREVTFPQNRVLTGGKVARFSVDMTGVAPAVSDKQVYYPVTDASVLKEGDEVIITNPAGTVAMSTNQKDKNRGSTAVTLQDGNLVNPAADVEILTLGAGTLAGTWSLKTRDGLYLAPNGTKNTLKSIETLNSYGSWDISVSGTEATLKAGNGLYVYLLYNHGSSTNLLFSCYDSTSKSNMDLVRLFRRDDSPAVLTDDPVLEYSEFGAYLTGGQFVFTPGKDQLSREYGEAGTTFSILTPDHTVLSCAGIPAGAVKGDSFTLRVRRDDGFEVTVCQDYPVRVVREDGARLWLSDGAGNGFIVKK